MGFVRDGDDGTGGGVPSRDDLVALAGAGGLHVFFGIQHPDGRFDATDLIDGLLPRLGLPREIGVDEELWIARIHPDDRQRYLDELGWQALSRGTARSVYRFEIEGGEVDLEEQIVPVERLADGGIRCVGIVTDVSSSRGAYDRAVGLARRLRVLFWDVVIQPDGGFEPTYRTSVNDTLLGATDEIFLGGRRPAGEPLGDAWRGRIHPDDVHLWEAAFLPERIGGTDRCEVEYRMVGYDGVLRTVREIGTVRERRPDGSVRMEGVVVDVSRERDTARQLGLARTQLARISSSIGAHTYQGLMVDGVFVELPGGRESAERFLGERIPPEMSIEEFWVTRIVPEDLERYLEWTNGPVDAVPLLEYRLRSPDGSIRSVTDWSFPTRDADGVEHIDGVVLDVTEAVRARRDAADHERRLTTVLAGLDLLVATVAVLPDGTREERFRGPGEERVLGGAAGPDLLAALAALGRPADAAGIEVALAEAVEMLGQAAYRFRVPRDGEERWLEVAFHARADEASTEVIVDCLCTDVTNEERATAALAAARDDAVQRLHRDDLTQIGSRTLGFEALRDALAAPGRGVAVALLDVDHFKRVNDTHRHAGGDAVLVAVAQRLEALAGQDATVARHGGEEFLVVIRDVGRERAAARIDRLRREVVTTPIHLREDDIAITLSAGLAVLEGDATPEQALDAADRALHAAKRRGRDRLVSIDQVEPEELISDDPDTLRLAEAMSEAVAPMVGETERHCRIVSRVAGEVAEELALGAVSRLRCRIAGMLHDVGKIAVPGEILGKPGALTPDERVLVQRHAEVGARMVRSMGGLADAADAVLHHHERWDGLGYPTGLAGEAIPIEARIIAAVDAWSAMIEPRVYGPALAPDEALDELVRCAATQFDPTVVGALQRVLDRPGLEVLEPVA